MRILTKLVFDPSLSDTDKAVMIALHYACEAKTKHVVKLSTIKKRINNDSINIVRSLAKLKSNKEYIKSYTQYNKATEYEFVMPSKQNSFETIDDEHLEKLLQYPKYLILFLKIKHVNWQIEQDAKKEKPQFQNEVKALRYYSLDIDDFEKTMDFLQGLGIVSTYQIKLSAELQNGEIIFNNIQQTVIKQQTKHIDNTKQVAEQPKQQTQQPTKKIQIEKIQEKIDDFQTKKQMLQSKNRSILEDIRFLEKIRNDEKVWNSVSDQARNEDIEKYERLTNQYKENKKFVERLDIELEKLEVLRFENC